MSGDFFEQAGGSLWNQYKGSDLFTVLGNRSNQTILQLAEEALAGKCFEAQDEDVKPLFHDWLRWIISDEPRARAWWHWIHEQRKGGASLAIKDRDEYTAALLRSITGPDGKNREAREQFEKQFTTWSYYEFYFFNWFLNRFNVVDALRLFIPSSVSRFLHLLLSSLSTLVVIGYFVIGEQIGCCWLSAFLLVVIIFFAGALAPKLQVSYYLQSLTLRLAVTTGIGYLFLFSASGLVAAIYTAPLATGWQIAISAAIILSVWAYIIQGIQRRVNPRPSLRRAVDCSLYLISLAVAYSAIGLLICKPVLFSKSFLKTISLDTYVPHSWGYLLIIAAIALAIGVALQLVWQDKPVTEPL